MMGYAEFQRVSSDPKIVVDVARFYDNQTRSKSGALQEHDIGWTIRVLEPGKQQAFGYFHVHWKPQDEFASVNHNISAHFKESHKSNKTLNRSGASKDLKPLDAALMYNGFVILNAKWDSYSPTAPKGPGAVGWTSLATRITAEMVNGLRKTNDMAGLKMLGKNPLYDLSKWEYEAWDSWLDWIAEVSIIPTKKA